MIRDYFLYSYNSLKKRKLRSYLTMIGIFIGIAAVVSLISLAQGMQDAIKAQFASFGSDAVTIQAGGVGGFGPPGSAVVEKLKEHDKDVVKRVDGVSGVASRMIRSVKTEYEDEVAFLYSASIPETSAERNLIVELNDYKIASGRFLRNGDRFKVVIGDDLATKNVFARNLRLRDKFLVEGVEVEVVGILEKKGNPQQDSTFIMPEDSLREITGDPEGIDVIVAKVAEGFTPAEVADDIAEEMRNDRNLEEGLEDFQVETAENVIAALSTILSVVQWVLIGIAAISLLVGGIGIMNTMYAAVLERTKEIGVMKALGAKDTDVTIIFLIESGLMGAVGGAVGVLVGVSFSKLVEFIASTQLGTGLLQANTDPLLILGAVMFSFLIGSFSGVAPAIQASRLKPVEALRFR